MTVVSCLGLLYSFAPFDQVMICLLQYFVESLTVVLPYYPTGTMERVVKEGQVCLCVRACLSVTNDRPVRLTNENMSVPASKIKFPGRGPAFQKCATRCVCALVFDSFFSPVCVKRADGKKKVQTNSNPRCSHKSVSRGECVVPNMRARNESSPLIRKQHFYLVALLKAKISTGAFG